MSSLPGWGRQTIPPKPNGWIQWKGTDVCMDVICVCRNDGHIDDKFVYYIRCSVCERVYLVNGNIELVELTKEEISMLGDNSASIKVI